MKNKIYSVILLVGICLCYCNKPQPSADAMVMDNNGTMSTNDENALAEIKNVTTKNGIYANQIRAPYEATWMELREDGDSYIVRNFPSLWNDGKTISPNIIKIQGNQLIWITYSDDVGTFEFNEVEKRDKDVYFFRVGNYDQFEFEWFDKSKHIARWTMYYGKGEKERVMSNYLYVDSLHNPFPIVDYEWENGCCDEDYD